MATQTSFNVRDALSQGNLLEMAMNRKLLQINTSLPCQIISINTDLSYNVQPIINGLDVSNNPITQNIIYDVPASMELSSNLSIQHQYEIGDIVLVGFVQRNMDNCKYNGWTIQNPDNYRLFDMQDAIIIRGIQSANTPKVTIVISNSGTITINATEADIIAQQANIQADTVNLGNSNLQKVLLGTTQFNVTVTGVQSGGDVAYGTATPVVGTESQTVMASE